MICRLFLGAVLLLAPACAKEVVAHQQTEGNANRILDLLNKEGITAAKIKDEKSRDLRFDISVPKDDEAKTYSIMVRYNLPETTRPGTQELFGEGGLIPTSEEQRAKREIGIGGDIVNSLRRIPRVVEASALVSIPDDNPLRDVNEAKPKPKAAVIVSFLPDEKGNSPISTEDIQKYVQASLPELRSTEVAVQLVPITDRSNQVGLSDLIPGVPGGGTMLNACEKTTVIGIDVCADAKKKMLTGLVFVVVGAGILAGLVMISVLRAMRYRKDLTRLTAQVAQLKPRDKDK